LILAVAGSKGGVGKSSLIVNVAVALARWGRKILLVDGDLALANLDVLLGLAPAYTIEQLLSGEASLEEVLVEGPAGIRILPAASGIPELAGVDMARRARLLGALVEASRLVDDTLVDTGPGLAETTLGLQLAAAKILLVTTPEPTSLVDAYATLKVLWSADPDKSIDLVINAADGDEDAAAAFEQIARISRHFLGRAPTLLGVVYRDAKVAEAVRCQRPLLELFPDSPAARCYEQLALRLTLSPAAGSPADYWQRLMVAKDHPH
jgi:flagellar biosynthesis protein FlhG